MASQLKRRHSDDDGINLEPETNRRKKAQTQRVPQRKATVKQLASNVSPKAATNADERIIERIKKCLERANHPNTPEQEAKAALFLSSRLMTQHNVTNADLMAESDNDCAQHGGSSVVSIHYTKEGKRVCRQTWVGTLASAMNAFFTCKSYSTEVYTAIDWTFYGIAENTATAAVAFEIAYNRILEWSCAHKGISASFSYCCGVADGLLSMAHREKKRERDEVRKKDKAMIAEKEREERSSQEQRALGFTPGDDAAPSGGASSAVQVEWVPDAPSCEERQENVHEHLSHDDENVGSTDFYLKRNDDPDSDDDFEMEREPDFKVEDSETLDLSTDLDQEIQRILKQEQSAKSDQDGLNMGSPKEEKTSVKLEQESTDPISDVPWASEMQLIKFCKTADQVAEEVLKASHIKLRSGKKRTVVKDKGAYRQGKKDSGKIDVRQKLVE